MTLARTDRMAQYGHPIDNFRAIAAYWRVHVERKHGVDVDFDPDDVGAMMILLKLARDANQPKPDNLDDISGYADCLRMTREAEQRESEQSKNTLHVEQTADVLSHMPNEASPTSFDASSSIIPVQESAAFTSREQSNILNSAGESPKC